MINHKIHIKRIDNTFYKHLYECKRRAWIRGAETQGQKSGEKGKTFGGILPEPYQSILCDASARG